MTIYTDLQSMAADLLKEFKQGTTNFIKITKGSGDEDDPGKPIETFYSIDSTVTGVSEEYVSSGFAIASDLEITFNVSSDFTPTTSDFIEIDGVRYKIISDISKPAVGTRVIWKFIVRKGG